MGVVRASLRLPAVILSTAFAYLAVMAGVLMTVPFPRARVRWRNFWFRNWARTVLAVLGARIECLGTPPRPPFFLVTNHLSYIDILLLASQLDAVFIAKSEVARWPLVGMLCRSVGTLFVDRNSHRDLPRVIEAIDGKLRDGQGVVLFPEGTSTRGSEVAPFRPSLLEVAARAPYSVSCASIRYETDVAAMPAETAVCWWGDMEFAGHLWNMMTLPGFRAKVVFGENEVTESDRKLLATRLWREVDALFAPVVEMAEPV